MSGYGTLPRMKVIKIGGGCLKDGPAAEKIIRLIAQRGEGDIFVLSAFYGVTDILIAGINAAMEDEHRIPALISRLKKHHADIVRHFIEDSRDRKTLTAELDSLCKKLERCYYGVSFTREATPRMTDMIAVFGEKISGVILTHALAARGKESRMLLPEDGGIISDGKFTDASAVMARTAANLSAAVKDTMSEKTILFVPGFYGVTDSGDITTFGRGGSDYSAAVVAASVNADVLEIWKDTEGFMTADPDNIPHCRLIPELTYEEAAELSYTGAGILHPRTVEPVKKAGIDITVKNTFAPDTPGSRITKTARQAETVIKSVSYTTDVSVLKIYAPDVGARFGILSRITDHLAAEGINIKSVVTSQTCISLLLSLSDIERGHRCIRKIRPVPYRRSSTKTDVALVSIVGRGLHKSRGIAARCFTAVSDAGVNIEMISFGTSDAALYFLVPKERLDVTIHALHEMFFG